MNSSNSSSNSNILSADMKNISAKPKSLTPSVLGVANSHGVKLSVNMSSEDKRELMSKLEEWRKARKDKLAARILSKQKQFEKPKAATFSLPSSLPKHRPPSVQNDGASKIQERQSVFDRLYNNSGKVKRVNVNGAPNKLTMIPKTDTRKPTFMLSEKINKPKFLSKSEETEKNPLNEGSSSSQNNQLPPCSPPLSPKNTEETQVTENKDDSVMVSARQKEVGEVSSQPSLQGADNEALKNFQTVPVKLTQVEKCKNPLRRSISMMFRKKHRHQHFVRRSFSAKNLSEFNSKELKFSKTTLLTALRTPLPHPAVGDEAKPRTKSVSFHTPKCETNLRMKLENWLKQNGHPLEGYRHLRCFGVERDEKSLGVALPAVRFPTGREAASSAPVDSPPSAPSVRQCTPTGDVDDDGNKENVTPPTEAKQLDAKEVENWLKELHRLVVELKYPPERCEEWLVAIRKKYKGCTLLPIYWECLAALNESKGDLKSAIEDYERAIIKGGGVDAVGDSLEQLFEKMVIDHGKRSKSKLEKGLDPKNIFKSTIIKFALQQKALKKLSSAIDPSVREQLYVATPVRRSTRIQTPYKSSEEVASLHTLTPELRKSVIFKPNDSLLCGD